jgi:hypothetical protein
MTNTDIADTIVRQLGRSTGNLSMMLGAHGFIAGENSLTFRFKARAKNGSNCIRITLEPTDTYKVEFLSVRGTKVTPKGDFSDVYADSLKRVFEGETGLYLSL